MDTEGDPAARGDSPILDDVIAGYLKSIDAGQPTSREEMLQRHPGLRDELVEFFADHDRVDPLARAMAPAPEIAPCLAATRSLGDYELIEELARGGMGVVYRARHTSLDRIVALKAIIGGRLASSDDVQRFRREARAVAALDHPRIVPILDVGEHDGIHYFTMKLMEGGSLADPRAPHRRGVEDSVKLVESVARTVAFAHRRGIVHRDLKPANILLDAEGEPHISDFGLAKPIEQGPGLTRSGEVVGTASYMAPEQATGRKGCASAASDVYGLGAILYTLLGGRPPFVGESSVDTLRKVLEDEPSRPRALNAAVSLDLEAICLKCLEKEPARRYASADALADDLRRFLAREPVEARRIGSMERGFRWCRRHRAATVIGALLFLMAFGSSGGALWINVLRRRAVESLGESRFLQARALTLSGRAGQRLAALDAVKEAAKLRPTLELRNVAVAAIAATDIRIARRWDGMPAGTESVAFDAAFERYARGDAGGNVSVRTVDTDRETSLLERHGQPARVIGFTSDGRRLAVLYAKMFGAGALRVWNLETNQAAFDAAEPALDQCVDIDVAGRQIATADENGALRVYDIATGAITRQLAAGGRCAAVQFRPDGKKIAAAVSTKVLVWDLDSGSREAELEHHEPAAQVAWHPDGHRLAVATHNAQYLWDVPRGTRLTAFRASEMGGFRIAMSTAGDLVASWSYDGDLQLRSLSGRILVRQECLMRYPRWSGGDRLLGYSSAGNSIALWEVAKSDVFSSVYGGEGYPNEVHLDSTGRLASLSVGDGVRVWDVARRVEVAWIPIGPVNTALFSDAETMVTSGRAGLHRWPIERVESTDAISVRIGPPREICPSAGPGLEALSVSADRKRLLVEAHGRAALIDVERGEVLKELAHHNVVWLALSPDSRWIATGPLHGSEAKVWDAQSGGEVLQIPAQVSVMCASVLFHPDSRRLVVSLDSEYAVWDVETRRKLRSFPRQDVTEIPGPMAFTRNGNVLAITTTQRRIQLLDFETGSELASLLPPESAQQKSLCFDATGDLLVSAVMGLGVHVWDLRKLRRELGSLGLDWEAPPGPAQPDERDSRPIRVEVNLGDLKGASK